MISTLRDKLSSEQIALVCIRSILSFIALATSYESLQYISLGLYGSIHIMQPLISYMVGYCMFDRSMHITELANLHISAIAVYLIAKGEAPSARVFTGMLESQGLETAVTIGAFIGGIQLKSISTVLQGLSSLMLLPERLCLYSH